ncbi:putative B3 domain-containing protein At1g78640 [Ipomoea triloba]|uniref:putative B3 domain-containing protein At1g78640 n=1 Tax=Ipomoea triloba TaxID=35885 RepID=UPI00125DE141|nr:putative B3 domain-containing protein At1g78640 [Ipomoea triloba]
MKRKRQKTSDPRPHKTQNHSHSTKTSDVGVAKKQRVEGDDGHWIKKRLSLSDVNESARLLLGNKDVRKHVLALMDEDRCAACESREGLRVKMWDLDTLSEHELSLKQWQTGSFVINNNWSMEFVKRRNLQEGDYIGLRWDAENLGFFFHKFNAQS